MCEWKLNQNELIQKLPGRGGEFSRRTAGRQLHSPSEPLLGAATLLVPQPPDVRWRGEEGKQPPLVVLWWCTRASSRR